MAEATNIRGGILFFLESRSPYSPTAKVYDCAFCDKSTKIGTLVVFLYVDTHDAERLSLSTWYLAAILNLKMFAVIIIRLIIIVIIIICMQHFYRAISLTSQVIQRHTHINKNSNVKSITKKKNMSIESVIKK